MLAGDVKAGIAKNPSGSDHAGGTTFQARGPLGAGDFPNIEFVTGSYFVTSEAAGIKLNVAPGMPIACRRCSESNTGSERTRPTAPPASPALLSGRCVADDERRDIVILRRVA